MTPVPRPVVVSSPRASSECGDSVLSSTRKSNSRAPPIPERAALEEEVGVTLTGKARLMGLYANFREFKSDHVALYVVGHGAYEHAPRRSPEIAESGFFPPQALPMGISPSTARRIAEVIEGHAPDELW